MGKVCPATTWPFTSAALKLKYINENIFVRERFPSWENVAIARIRKRLLFDCNTQINFNYCVIWISSWYKFEKLFSIICIFPI